jgi:hypothetical protein
LESQKRYCQVSIQNSNSCSYCFTY